MRVGIVVDGQAEFRSLPKIKERIGAPHVILNPLYADIQPFSSAPQIVGAVKTQLRILVRQGAEMALVLLDHESRQECPGAWAQEISQNLAHRYGGLGMAKLGVIVKNSCFENWLVSDIEAFIRMLRRINLIEAAKRAIQPNKADNVDAQEILKRAAQGDAYSKVADAIRIMMHIDPVRMAANSRSFRKFLREIEHPLYVTQSRTPA
ncbi:MAG: DUF4276 family protein [Acidobacteria bacterium]|nr:DUF4276 family protein [Acidobacteriota bacterium]